WRAAGLACAALIAGMLAVSWVLLPQSRSVLPVRLTIAGIVITLGMGYGAHLYPRFARRPRRRTTALAIATTACVLGVMTLWRWGADLETKYIAITASPALDQLVKAVRL